MTTANKSATKKSSKPVKEFVAPSLRSRFHERIYVQAACPGTIPATVVGGPDPLKPFEAGIYVGEYHLISIIKVEKVAKLVESGAKA